MDLGSRILIVAAAAASQAGASPSARISALVLMTVILLLLGLLLIIVLIVTLSRGRRMGSKTRRAGQAAPQVDAWEESARRTQPLDAGGDREDSPERGRD